MPVAMHKSGGGSRYGVAVARFDTKTSYTLEDADTGDRLVFAARFDADKKDKSSVAELVRAGKAGWVVIPARNDRPERKTLVYPGLVSYSCNAKADVLYQVGPAQDTHILRFVGFARKDEASDPVWELQENKWEKGAPPRRIFAANFATDDADAMPGLEVRWGFWPYVFAPVENGQGEKQMGVALMSSKAGEGSKALYLLLREAKVIGKDKSMHDTVLLDVPYEAENYLPAVEAVLQERLAGVRFGCSFETKKGEKDGRTRVNLSGLHKLVEAAAPKPKAAKRK